jgi:hypothetical protein
MVYTCTYILMYKHVCTLFRRVCTCLYKYMRVSTYIKCTYHVHTCTYMSVTCFLFTYMYVKVCTADVLCTDGYIHFIQCTDIVEQCIFTDVSFGSSFFICPAGWPVGRVTPGCCQVSCLFKFKHTSLMGISLSSLPLSTQCPHLPYRAWGRCRSCRLLPATAGARSASAGVAPGRTAALAPATASAASTPSLLSSWS